MTPATPVVGELVHGCRHVGPACGRVAQVLEHVQEDGLNHFIVREDWMERQIRVRREPNGALYEVEVVYFPAGG